MKNKMTSPKSLRCDEVFAPQTPPLIPNTDNNLNQDLLRQQQEQFCKAYRDGAILNDARVVANMLHLENFYKADMETSYSAHRQNEIKPHMRKIVAEWMLEVTEDQRCHVDVFLLAINIMDRFLATISLQKKQFQLLGAASIFIASKMLEPSPIAAVTLIKYTADTYDREELLSMELLILSKLQWDLTAITAYDYLDYLLTTLMMTSAGNEKALKSSTEKLIAMCAAESQFMELPPSLIASASLASAVQQDFESNPPCSDLNLNEIVRKLQRVTKTEMNCLRSCIEQIEDLFISGALREPTSSSSASEGYFSTSQQQPNSSSSSSMSLSSSQQSRESDQKSRSDDNKTPTEVFDVSAFCVT